LRNPLKKQPGLLQFTPVKPGKIHFRAGENDNKLSNYAKNIGVVAVFLSVITWILAFRLGGYSPMLAVAVVFFMTLNALGAVYPLYRLRTKNPFNVYILGMLIRMAVIGVVWTLFLGQEGISQKTLLAVILTAMFSFVAFLTVEIRHFMRHPENFQSAL
jgi:hypothetical protein